MLSHHSGLAGLANVPGGDMKRIEMEASTNPLARLACDVFNHRLIKYIGAYISVLGGLDTLAFGGGIGEHGVQVRRAIIEHLSTFMPIELDLNLNQRATKETMKISTEKSKIEVWMVAVDEGEVMVQDAIKLITEPRSRL